jgi:ParB/RepB/Spo0J family partition protein
VTGAARGPELRQIPLALIDAPPLPSRTTMDDAKMEELVESILLTGFWSVLVVVMVGERARVVAGHRRSIAARRAGLTMVPCFVFDAESAALDWIQDAENTKREDVSVTDQAIWYAQLLEKYPESGTDGVAARVGKSRDVVEGRLALLQGCERVFAALADALIPIGVAQELNKCTEDRHRFMLLDHAVRGGATVGLVRQWVYEWKTVHQPAAAGVVTGATTAASGSHVVNEWQRCRICGETDDPGARDLLNVHSYCLRPLLDPTTGLLRARADYVVFPRTVADAVALIHRLVDRFPELSDSSAAPTETAPRSER